MFKSIQWKILALFIILTVIVMTFVAVFSARGVKHYYHEQFAFDMEESVFTESMTKQLNTAAESSFSELCDLLGKFSVRIGIDSYRELYILSGYDARCLFSLSGRALDADYEITGNVLAALNGEVGGDINDHGEIMDYAVPMMKGSDVEYIIYVTDTKVEMYEVMKSILTNIFLALLIGIFLSVFLGFVLSITLIKPLKRLQKSASQLAEGNFTGKIKVNNDDEIGRLTKDFNYMSEALETSMIRLEAEKNKVETVLLYMTDGVMAFNSEGNLIHINPAVTKLLDIKEEEIGDFDSFFEFLGTDINMGQFLYLATEPFERSISLGEKHLRVYLAPLQKNGKVDGVVAVFHDYTRQQKLDDARREFVANVSHELRTPITVVKSYTETLMDMGSGDETQAHMLGVINDETDRMTRLIRDLLALSKLDNNREMQKLPVDLPGLVTSVCDRLAIEANEHRQTIERDIDENVGSILIDKDRIEQVIVNIVGNAIKYTKDGGKIEVGLRRDEEKAYIRVKDNGIGIPKEDQERIFERFYRVDKARSRAMGGTGLGLAIAKEIVDAHGGTINLESHEGRGTTVTIILPFLA
ncbi:MAG: HAMP domain-containing protein [Clostridia bacterium]|nr:HAMP domain-containing protein [Clostridia bacterium]